MRLLALPGLEAARDAGIGEPGDQRDAAREGGREFANPGLANVENVPEHQAVRCSQDVCVGVKARTGAGPASPARLKWRAISSAGRCTKRGW